MKTQGMIMINPLILHFRTPEDFKGYLANLTAPKWFTKVAVHHTLSPTVPQWRGLATMKSILGYYQNVLRWNSYPHIFVAPDGIWQMNNVLELGTHTNAANKFSIAVEVVGNYDKHVWQEPIHTYALETILALQKWNKLHTSDIVLHRRYNTDKTCPGKAISFDWVVNSLEELAIEEAIKTVKYRVRFNDSRIRQGPGTHYPIAGKLFTGDIFISEALKEDEGEEYINGVNTWAHVTKAVNTKEKVDNLGFVHRSLLEVIE